MGKAYRIIRAFQNILAGYDRDKLQPGYKGKFVIQKHLAEKAGGHWDFRLEFPVTSVAKALGHYEKKRTEDTREPRDDYQDKPGSVYRSFAVRKMTFPNNNRKLFIVETENHPMAYGTFKGEIEEGYGKGTVDIFDKGTFELVSVNGDKQYVMDFAGKKLNGLFALVKYKNGFLWVKTKNKEAGRLCPLCGSAVAVTCKCRLADSVCEQGHEWHYCPTHGELVLSGHPTSSIGCTCGMRTAGTIDYVHPIMLESLWDQTRTPPILIRKVRDTLIKEFTDACKKGNLNDPFRWVTFFILTGSSTGYNYREDGDIDIQVGCNPSKVREVYPKMKDLSDEDILGNVREIVYKINDRKLPGTKLTYSYWIPNPGEKPSGDAMYDLRGDRWIVLPIKLPIDFDPDTAFIKEKAIAWEIGNQIELLIGKIMRVAEDFKKLDVDASAYNPCEILPKLQGRKVILLNELRHLCGCIDTLHARINDLPKQAKNSGTPIYSAFPFGMNWDSRKVIFKYLERYGYSLPIWRLYERMKGDPVLKVIDRFIPD